MEVIYECILGLKHFVSFCAGLPIEGMLEYYERSVGMWKSPAEDTDILVASLLNWLETEYPPRILMNMAYRLEQIGLGYLHGHTKKRLHSWVQHLRIGAQVSSKHSEHLHVVLKLRRVVILYESLLSGRRLPTDRT